MSKGKTLVFAGTHEGHILAETISKLNLASYFEFAVATDYGKDILEDIENISVREGRLTEDHMIEIFSNEEYEMVIDATHPYAQVVTANIKSAAEKSNVKYVRLLRAGDDTVHENMIFAGSIENAVEILNTMDGNVLLTTGAKELSKYTGISNFENRVFARVLPSIESIEICMSVGMQRKNMICMQGPFTMDMNVATMEQYKCKTLVTKNTGNPGGFQEKVALGDMGYKIIVIERPTVETGFSIEEVVKIVEGYYGN